MLGFVMVCFLAGGMRVLAGLPVVSPIYRPQDSAKAFDFSFCHRIFVGFSQRGLDQVTVDGLNHHRFARGRILCSLSFANFR